MYLLKCIKSVFLTLLLTATSLVVTGQRKKHDLWQSWKDVNLQLKAQSKPLLIDIHTTWCYYCKVMDATTYRNHSVYAYLKAHYYRFKFDAETRDTLEWSGKAYYFNERYQVHDFAVYLSHGSIVYPTTVIITPGGQPYYQFGEIKAGEMELILKYFSEGIKTGITLEDYAKKFKSSW